MKSASAFAPGHLTGLFQICDGPKDPMKKGSRGAGVSINRGVTTKVCAESSETELYSITINNDPNIEAPVSWKVIEKISKLIDQPYKIKIEHSVETPITAGFGSSGSGALSLCLALNRALNLDMSHIEAAKIAHIAEIECRTGLGSVTAALHGGFGVSYLPGGPGINQSESYQEIEGLKIVYLYFGPISTKDALVNPALRKKINEIGGSYVDQLHDNFTPTRFMDFSRCFAEHVSLITPRLRKVLEKTDQAGYNCTMAMFGEVLFSVLETEKIDGLLKILKNKAPEHKVVSADIDNEGAHIIS